MKREEADNAATMCFVKGVGEKKDAKKERAVLWKVLPQKRKRKRVVA